MAILVTGAAGFIGTKLVEFFLTRNKVVFGFDNLSRGTIENMRDFVHHPNFHFSKLDLSDFNDFSRSLSALVRLEPVEEVWHFAANSDISSGILDPTVDLKNTFMSTFNTLQVMREFDIPVLFFASSSAVYGDLGDQRLAESSGPLLPISNYGAMKLASEAAISAAAESFLKSAYIFRFPNVIGVPATHGVILDFFRHLERTPERLSVLGNGSQQKAYLHVDDLIAAMHFIRENAHGKINLFNIGPEDEGVTVKFIAEQVVAEVSEGAQICYGDTEKGWVGDVPKFSYSVDKLKALGWSPRFTSVDSVKEAIRQISVQEKK